jgi:hypothetical protein
MARHADALGINSERVDIPGTSLKVSRIALGTWAIGGWMWGGTDEAEAIRTIQAAVDCGITLIDTAPVYGLAAAASAEISARRNLSGAAALPTEGTAMTREKMPPVPKANRSPKGTGSDPDPKDDKQKPKEPKNVDQNGERANVRQNTSNVQDKR